MYKAKKMNEFGTSIFTELKIMKQEYTEKTGKDTIDFSIGSPNIPPVDSITVMSPEQMPSHGATTAFLR